MATKKTDLRYFTDGAQHSLIAGEGDLGQVLLCQVDEASHSLCVVSHEHHEIHEGSSFRAGDSLTLNSGISQDYLITTPNTTKWAHLTFHGDGTAVTTFEAFEGADRVGTTLLTAQNANRNSLVTATTTMHKGHTGGTTDGVQIFKYASGTATNQSRSAAGLDAGNEWILKQNTKYVLRITSGTAGNLINIVLNWYEHTSLK